jgi:hypothetical protein
VPRRRLDMERDDHLPRLMGARAMKRGEPRMTRLAYAQLARLLTASVALAGCASARPTTAPSHPAAPSPIANTATPRAGLTPTPSSAPSPLLGNLTAPLPAGVTAVIVTLTDASNPNNVLYRATVVDASEVQAFITATDALRTAGSASNGCTGSPVSLRLDFLSGSNVTSTLTEDSACRYGVLTINGSPGPQLDSAELPMAEAMLHVTSSYGPDGKPTVSPASPSAS